MTFGQALAGAHSAPDDEKASTFAHKFLGFGVGNFLGWEAGRRLLNKTQVVSRTMQKLGLSKFIHKLPIKLPFTVVGFATELLAMFGFG